MYVTDESGALLVGALDGTNCLFTTSRDMRTDMPVEVYVNGILVVSSLDDGFDVVNTRTVRMHTPPVPLDTLAVKFSVDPPAIGLLGGAPQIVAAQVLGAGVVIGAQVVDPSAAQGTQAGGQGTYVETLTG